MYHTSGASTSNYGFAGEWTDSYIKLIHLRSRYYAPTTGRFLTKDVWPGDYTRPLSLNGWNYVEGNPVNFTDPSGHIPCGDLEYGCSPQPGGYNWGDSSTSPPPPASSYDPLDGVEEYMDYCEPVEGGAPESGGGGPGQPEGPPVLPNFSVLPDCQQTFKGEACTPHTKGPMSTKLLKSPLISGVKGKMMWVVRLEYYKAEAFATYRRLSTDIRITETWKMEPHLPGSANTKINYTRRTQFGGIESSTYQLGQLNYMLPNGEGTRTQTISVALPLGRVEDTGPIVLGLFGSNRARTFELKFK